EIERSEAQARERDVVIAERKRQKVTDDLELIGNNLSDTELTAGSSFNLALVWRATRDVAKEYEARFRIVRDGDNAWGEGGLAAAGPTNPTAGWERMDIF